MADNFLTNPGAAGATFGSDEISTVHYPRIKLIHGADGTNAGDVAVANPLPVIDIGTAANGLLIFKSLDIDESEEEVKATAGVVYGCWVTNTATATRWLKFYNATAANVTVGSTTPVITIGIPGNTSDDVSANFNVGGKGIGFATAITVAATTLPADNDATAPGTGDVVVMVYYV